MQTKHLLQSIATLIAMTIILSCARSEPKSSNKDASMGGLFTDVMGTPKGFNRNDPGWPANPRRELQHQQIITEQGKVTFGLGGTVLGAEASSTVEINLTTQAAVTTYIMATTDKDKGETIFDMSTPPQILLNYWKGRDMVIMCIATVSYSVGREWSGKLKVLSNGVETSVNFKEITTLNEVSKMRRPNMGESASEAIESCNDFYYSAKPSLKKDLNAALTQIFVDTQGAECIIDDDCIKFHNSKIGLLHASTVGRCIHRDNGNFFCALRNLEGAACEVLSDPDANGTRHILSQGYFEFPCDDKSGLTCVQTKPAGYFSYAEATCQQKKN